MTFLSHLPFYLLVAFVFLTMISVLVAAHEYGHYIFARMFGMGVEEFAIGMGKKVKVLGYRTYAVDVPGQPEGETETTEFTIRALPIGGFVRIKGMIPEEDGSEISIPGGFYSKAPWKRLLVLVAGPLFSVLAGVLILIPLYMTVGIDQSRNEPVLGFVGAGSPASLAGMQAKDRVLSINGQPMHTFYDMIAVVQGNPGKQLRVVFEHNGDTLSTILVPKLAESPVWSKEPFETTPETRSQGVMGVTPDSIKPRLAFGQAVSEAAHMPVKAVEGLVGIFTKPKTFKNSVGGPGTMVAATAAVTERGLPDIFWLAAMLSISVGIFNLLPVAPLDGGQMTVAFAEMLRGGRRLAFKVQNVVNVAGFALVAMLVLAVLTVDFNRLVPKGNDPGNDTPAKSAPAPKKP